jgi:hypothetical protein
MEIFGKNDGFVTGMPALENCLRGDQRRFVQKSFLSVIKY